MFVTVIVLKYALLNLEFYLNNTINLCHLPQRITLCYTHKMAIISWPQTLWRHYIEMSATSFLLYVILLWLAAAAAAAAEPCGSSTVKTGHASVVKVSGRANVSSTSFDKGGSTLSATDKRPSSVRRWQHLQRSTFDGRSRSVYRTDSLPPHNTTQMR